MGFKVTAPLVIIPNADGRSGDWYGYDGATVPPSHNDERCKQLVKEGMLEKVKDTAKAETKADPSGDSKPTSVKDILADVGEDKAKAQEYLDEENAAEKPRTSLVEKLQAVLSAES